MNNPAPAAPLSFADIPAVEPITERVDLSPLERIFAEYGRKPPRLRELEVSDEHIVELLTGVTMLLLAKRAVNVEPSLALLEMQAALNAMVTA